MTQPDIYTIEARRRLAAEYQATDMPLAASDVLRGAHSTTAVNALAATLRELNWQPPIDPDLVEARKLSLEHGWHVSAIADDLALAAIKRGRELAAQERGA